MPSKKKQPKELTFVDFGKKVKEQMRKTGKTEEEALMDILFNTSLFSIDEAVLGTGYAILDQLGPWEKPKAIGIKGEKAPEVKKRRMEYRRLREEFAPVSAGIEYHRAFTSGSGFINQISDPNDKHQKLMKETIDAFCENVYQDEYNIGLDHLIDILLDSALVEGASAAEIVYGNTDVKFMDYVTGTKDVVVGKKPDDSNITEKRFVVKEPDWKKFRDGITRLKIIDGAIDRLEPIRDTESFEVLYWVLDKNTKDPIFLHTWQILWITWNARGRKLKGFSLVKPVYVAAKLLEQIQYNVGLNFSRWADKKYFFICVPPETEVWTPEGYRQIKDIQVGDEVWSKHSTAEVLQTFKNPYKGDLITIKPKMLESVSFTPNHPIKVARKHRLRTKEGHEKYLTEFKVLDSYKRADELTTDDYVIVPKIKESHDVWVEFPDLSHRQGWGHGQNPKPLKSQWLSEDLAKIFGWYLAEGCPSSKNNGVIFSLGKTETHYAKEIIDLLWKTLGLKAKISEKATGLQVVVNSKVLSEFMVKWFGKGANNKHLPQDFLYWKPKVLGSMMSRIVMGDGHLGKDNWYKLKLNSKTLQKQLQLVLLKLGHRAGLSFVKRDPIGYIQGRKINQHDAWILTWNEENKVIAEDEDNHYFRIMEITKKLFEGYVYNFHSSMNEMLLPFRTKQCGTEKRPWGKVHTANFIRDVKRMKKKNLSALPVPAGFSVKEIGGEVFDGANITDYLLGMISAGMQYPKELIAGAERGESEKAWLAWVVRYGRNQQQLKRSIEHQLFKRHLWSIWGKEQTIRKQGVKPDKRATIPTFIPKIVWGAEGRWAKETKIKTLKLLGDMANPASPELHLSMQKDMAETLGYGQLDWKDTEDFITLNKKIKVVEAKRQLLRSKALLKRDEELGEEGLVKKIGEEEKVKRMMLEQSGKEEGDDEVSQEERLKKQQKKRLKGGVSRTTKGGKTKKGKAKRLGAGPRKVE